MVSYIRSSSFPSSHIYIYIYRYIAGIHTNRCVMTGVSPSINTPCPGTAVSVQTQRVHKTDLDPNLRGEHGLAASVLLTHLLPASGVRLSPSVPSQRCKHSACPKSLQENTNRMQTPSPAMTASLGSITYLFPPRTACNFTSAYDAPLF